MKSPLLSVAALALAVALPTRAQDLLALNDLFAATDGLPTGAAAPLTDTDRAAASADLQAALPPTPDPMPDAALDTPLSDRLENAGPAEEGLLTRPLGLVGAGVGSFPALAALAPGDPAAPGLDPLAYSTSLDVAALDTVRSPIDTLRMSLWERVWWGHGGVFRRTGLFPLHPENPTDDLRQIATVRRTMLSWHQTLGLVTVASMATTVVAGQLAVSTGEGDFHKTTLPITIGLYSATAALSLLSPPKLVSFDGGGIDSITIHRWLAVGHVAGMILTPLLAPEGTSDARVHQISGYATFGTFAAAMLVVTFLRR